MNGSAIAILAASLLGSVHCAGMCGPFVCFYASGASSSHSPLRAHALYNVGRLVSYVLLGAIAGGLGAQVTHAAALAGVANGAVLVSGIMMTGWGVMRIAALRGVRIDVPFASVALPATQLLGHALQLVRSRSIGVRALATGFVTTLLPCGWLYVFVAAAGGTGSVQRGMLSMALFWLGNVPALVAVGIGAQRALGPFQRKLPMVSAIFVTTLGLFALAGRFSLSALNQHHVH